MEIDGYPEAAGSWPFHITAQSGVDVAREFLAGREFSIPDDTKNKPGLEGHNWHHSNCNETCVDIQGRVKHRGRGPAIYRALRGPMAKLSRKNRRVRPV